jgi:hypothetical protein
VPFSPFPAPPAHPQPGPLSVQRQQSQRSSTGIAHP